MKYDVIVIGSGPGGYVAAIRASQLGKRVAVVERTELGGICLNWGCIPTKALLKSASVYEYMKHANDYGIKIEGEVKPDFEAIVQRSRTVAQTMNAGIQYLFKKNNVDVVVGTGKLTADRKVEVTNNDGEKVIYEADSIILATGARSKVLPNLPQDGKKIIGYREALTLDYLPSSMVVVGSGAIGSEFANFYNTMGTKVTLVEFLPFIVPVEDEDVSRQLERSFKKSGMKVMTSSSVKSIDTTGELCKVTIETKRGEEIVEAQVVLSAVGVETNLQNLGLEEIGVKTERGKIEVNEWYETNIKGVYAIGDIVHGPALAHVASAEAIVCVEKICGHSPKAVNYDNIPGCTYTKPEIASVGLTERRAKEAGFEVKVGKFPFTASGKATSAGARDGFIKVVVDAQNHDILGAHFVGENVTEMIEEVVLARQMGIKGKDIISTVHPHPTMSEGVMEAFAAAYEEAVHL